MLSLRTLRLEDAEALSRVYSGASVLHTTGRHLTLAEARTKVAADLAAAAEVPRGRWAWGITVDAELIGRIALRLTHEHTAALSYILREDTWGHGHATEAVKAAARHLFTGPEVHRLEAKHHPANPASGRVLAKAGFLPTGALRRAERGTVVTYPLYELHRT